MKKRRTIRLPRIIIVPHVHDRGMRQSYKTTTLEVLRQAMAALISVIIIMPNTNPAIINDMILVTKIKILNLARKILGNHHLQRIWFGATDKNYYECKKAIRNEYVVGVKVYPQKESGQMVTTGTAGTGVSCFKTATRLMMMTAERNLKTGVKKAVAYHPSHPDLGHGIEAEVAYVREILTLVRQLPKRLIPYLRIIFCHITCRESAKLILEAQEEGVLAAIEICIDYVWFDSDGTNWNPKLDSCFYHRYNNLRGSEEREYLISLLLTDNPLIFVSSDHAPHTREEKLRGAGGTPSIAEVVPAMITLAIKHCISEWRLAQLLSWNVSNFLNIPSSADLVEYEIEKKAHNFSYGENIVNHWNESEMWEVVREVTVIQKNNQLDRKKGCANG